MCNVGLSVILQTNFDLVEESASGHGDSETWRLDKSCLEQWTVKQYVFHFIISVLVLSIQGKAC
jgi:hypothetical protein